jgi:hypothetical protein
VEDLARLARTAACATASVLVVGCGAKAVLGPFGVDPAARDPQFVVTDPTDDDGDGIPDQLEDYLMMTFGPELRLAPDDVDWTRPANIDWYLPKVRMRFDHARCPDDQILGLGTITFANVATPAHYTKSLTRFCTHDHEPSELRHADAKSLEFFLQAVDDDAVHPGIPPARASEWRTYVQVRPSTYVRADGKAAAYDLQVWYFFPYNDNIAFSNHEADWEHMTISIASDFTFVSAFFAAHEGGHRFDDPAMLSWVDDTHVVGYLSDGDHATYESAGVHPGPMTNDHCYDDGPVWHSWDNFKNLGEAGSILNDQTWAAYGGRWGEVGLAGDTSGPAGPMFHSKWNTANEYPKR